MQGNQQSLKTPTSLCPKGTGSEGGGDINPHFHQEEKTAIDCKCRSTGNKEPRRTGPGKTVPVSCYEEGSPAIPAPPPRWTLSSVTHDRCVPLSNLPVR